MIVVDTNLLVYLYVPSRDTSLAEAVLSRDPFWISTPLWLSEFRKTLAGFIREGALTVEGGKRIVARAEAWMRGRAHAVSSATSWTWRPHPAAQLRAVIHCLGGRRCRFVGDARQTDSSGFS